MSATPGGVRDPAPLLGQHTDAVLQDKLGLSREELARLRERGILGSGKRAARRPREGSTAGTSTGNAGASGE